MPMPVPTDQLSGVQARTRAAILAATPAVLAADRTATMPDIAAAAGVGRTTLHRYFADRERLVYEATLESIRVLAEAVEQAATEQGSPIEAMRRLITAAVSVGDRILFLFGDPAILRSVAPKDHPNDDRILQLIKRGQREGDFDSELSASWIEHALFGLLLKGCQDSSTGELPRHTVAPLIIRTLERGIRPTS